MSAADRYRIQEKREIITVRIKEIAPNAETLIWMLDETKLDLLLIALSGLTFFRDLYAEDR